MIVFKCDICGQEAIDRTYKYSNFMMDDRSPVLPELIYENIHFVFVAQKREDQIQGTTPYMKRDAQVADICRECLIKAVTRGCEVTEEDLKAQVTA